MKKLIALGLFFCLSVNVFADISLQEKHVVTLLTSGDLKDLKIGAQQADGAKIKNPEVMDVAAEILLRMHRRVYSHQVDTLAWLARSLGSTKNSRYRSVLLEVERDGGSRKLQSHAKKALLKIPSAESEQYLLGMTSLPEGVYPLKTDADHNKELLSMVTSGDLAVFKSAAKQMVSSRNQSQEVGDAVAEVLLSSYGRNFEYESDSLAWAAQALGVNASGRYHAVLTEVLKSTKDKRVRKYAKKALKAHGTAEGTQYTKGMSSHPSKFL